MNTLYGYEKTFFKPRRGQGHMVKFSNTFYTKDEQSPVQMFCSFVKESQSNHGSFKENLNNPSKETTLNFKLSETELGQVISLLKVFSLSHSTRNDFPQFSFYHKTRTTDTVIYFSVYTTSKGSKMISMRAIAKQQAANDIQFSVLFDVGEAEVLRVFFESCIESMLKVNGNYQLRKELVEKEKAKSNYNNQYSTPNVGGNYNPQY